ncbi:hypothetical protein QJQ45_011306 [Haematococcus lacustris]|nr:hypothetical protein QJQ45_011306 [Haematococcus lacustris]
MLSGRSAQRVASFARTGEKLMATERHKPSQGDLVQAVLLRSAEPLIDIGANLGDPSFDKDMDAVIQRARNANVATMIVTGTCSKTCSKAQRLCDQSSYPLYFTAGVHPHNAKECYDLTLTELRRFASHAKCVAIGECGLDFNRNFSPQAVQLEWFEKQVALAVELRKPLFMHCREAAPQLADVLRRYLPLPAPAVVHCFTGNAQELACFLEMGLHIGITGWICDERPERGGAELARLLPSIPQDRLMLETDAPYLVPRTIKPSKARPGRNEPALLTHVLNHIEARVKACTTRALLASLLLGHMVRGCFTRVTALADGREAFDDIPVEDAIIPAQRSCGGCVGRYWPVMWPIMCAKLSKPRWANARFRLYRGKQRTVAKFWAEMQREPCKQFRGRVVLVHELRTSRVSSARTS